MRVSLSLNHMTGFSGVASWQVTTVKLMRSDGAVNAAVTGTVKSAGLSRIFSTSKMATAASDPRLCAGVITVKSSCTSLSVETSVERVMFSMTRGSLRKLT